MLEKMLKQASSTKRNGKKVSSKLRKKSKRLLRLYNNNNTSDRSRKDVYIITFDDTHYKIGVSSSIQERLKSIQTGSPYKLKIVYLETIDYAYLVENFIHLYFFHQNTHGEWFKLSFKDFNIAKKIIKNFSGGL